MKRSSVRPSVCLICRLQQWRVAGLLLSAPPAQDIDGQQSPALSSKCERCHVDSRWTRLNADLFFLYNSNLIDEPAAISEIIVYVSCIGTTLQRRYYLGGLSIFFR